MKTANLYNDDRPRGANENVLNSLSS